VAKGCLQHRKQQALQRSVRVEQRTQALRAVNDASSQEATSQPLLKAEAPAAVTPPSPTLAAARPSFSRACSRRKQHTACNRVRYSSQKSGEVSGEVCLCGTPLVRLKGRRAKQYCSDRCRQRAHRKRQTHSKPISAPARSAATLLDSSRPSAHHRQQGVTKRSTASDRAKCLSQGSGEVSVETCLCGTSLVQPIGGQTRRYCSHRCRQRAYRQRQVHSKPTSPPLPPAANLAK